MKERKLLTAAELADVLRLRPRTITAWGAAGRIPRVRCGARSIRYDLREVLAALSADLLAPDPFRGPKQDNHAPR